MNSSIHPSIRPSIIHHPFIWKHSPISFQFFIHPSCVLPSTHNITITPTNNNPINHRTITPLHRVTTHLTLPFPPTPLLSKPTPPMSSKTHTPPFPLSPTRIFTSLKFDIPIGKKTRYSSSMYSTNTPLPPPPCCTQPTPPPPPPCCTQPTPPSLLHHIVLNQHPPSSTMLYSTNTPLHRPVVINQHPPTPACCTQPTPSSSTKLYSTNTCLLHHVVLNQHPPPPRPCCTQPTPPSFTMLYSTNTPLLHHVVRNQHPRPPPCCTQPTSPSSTML